MPIISLFYGIIIRMFHNDHAPPHVHVQYGEHHAVVEINTGKILHGKLPKRTMKLVEEWRRKNLHQLHAAWNEAQNFIQPRRIKPLE